MEKAAMTAMERKVSFSWLLAFYGRLLTDNQREMARLHWEEDLSLSEIAGQFSVTRQSVHDTISRTEKQLESLEEKLGMLKRFQALEAGLTECEARLQLVVATKETDVHLQSAISMIKSLLDQEEQE